MSEFIEHKCPTCNHVRIEIKQAPAQPPAPPAPPAPQPAPVQPQPAQPQPQPQPVQHPAEVLAPKLLKPKRERNTKYENGYVYKIVYADPIPPGEEKTMYVGSSTQQRLHLRMNNHRYHLYADVSFVNLFCVQTKFQSMAARDRAFLFRLFNVSESPVQNH